MPAKQQANTIHLQRNKPIILELPNGDKVQIKCEDANFVQITPHQYNTLVAYPFEDGFAIGKLWGG